MKSKFSNSFLLITLAIVFTISLTFASIELPRLADNLLHQNYNFVNVYTGGDDLQELKTELFIRHFHLRTIGYLCLAAIIILIIIGFATNKSGFASLGAFAIFLPVFGHFAATMFFLGGLGFLRLLWLPGLDVTFDIMKIGDAVFIPYRIIIDAFNLVGINLNTILPYILIGIGLLIFCFGTIVWFYTYYNQKELADISIYKNSRHPQYLGWIIWSYGILFLPGVNMKQSYEISDSLPWLLSTLIIIGVAMMEEIKLSKKFGIRYENYRRRSFFMFPLPKYFCKVITSPFKAFFKKYYPTKKSEIVLVLTFYFFLISIITVLLNTFAQMKVPGKWIFESQDTRSVAELKYDFVTNSDRKEKYELSQLLVAKGDSSVQIFIDLLKNKDLVVREFSADALGVLISDKAVDPLITALNENNWRVQSSIINTLGKYSSEYAVNSLVKLLESESTITKQSAANALSKSCTPAAQNILIEKLASGKIKPTNSLLICIAKSNNEEAIDLLINFSTNENIEIRQTSVIGLMFLKSPKSIPILKKLSNDADWEVRLYAEEAIKEISNQTNST
ncbi:MAG: HEAT repeat domain-containing protein [Ignavibacteriales bacterium]|nr:HEAT repeat domain-containing protein [Ignavibacteriales bacterium]MCB9258981.1 HEAT repeat domain-containing protein [Ignavibacteriales bacterium]